MDISNLIDELYNQINSGNWTGRQQSVAYDTGWVASISDRNNKLVFPKAIDWLIDHQFDDGSWGSPRFTVFDRLLSTLSVLNTLFRLDIQPKARMKGIKWLQTIVSSPDFSKINQSNGVGFGLLFPSLLKSLARYIDLHPTYDVLIRKYTEKLGSLPLDQLTDKDSHSVFVIESLPTSAISRQNLVDLILPNGSIGCNPSTTAWALEYSGNNIDMLSYLRSTQNTDGGWPAFGSSFLFTATFVLYLLYKSYDETLPDNYHRYLHQIKEAWKQEGISFNQYFPNGDADDSSVALLLLQTQRVIDDNPNKYWDAILRYEQDEYFSTYLYKTGRESMRSVNGSASSTRASISVNLHILELFKHAPSFIDKDRVLDKVISFLEKKIDNDGFKRDRWHISPSYINCHGILALGNDYPDLSSKCLSWFVSNQNSSQLWGAENAELEPTAFAIFAISYYHLKVKKIDLAILDTAIEFLIHNLHKSPPPMWISKVLYDPIEIRRAHYFAALTIYDKAMKK